MSELSLKSSLTNSLFFRHVSNEETKMKIETALFHNFWGLLFGHCLLQDSYNNIMNIWNVFHDSNIFVFSYWTDEMEVSLAIPLNSETSIVKKKRCRILNFFLFLKTRSILYFLNGWQIWSWSQDRSGQ